MTSKPYKQNVLAIIFNNQGKVCLGKYNSENPSWTFPKGGVEEGESLIDALYREIEEETGIGKEHLTHIEQFSKQFTKIYSKEERAWKIEKKNKHFFGKIENMFLLQYSRNGTFTAHHNEFSEIRWVGINELGQYIKTEGLLECIDIAYLSTIICEQV